VALLHKIDKFDDLIRELNGKVKVIEDKLKHMVTHPDLELYVTWAALEENLKGIRDSLDSATTANNIRPEPTRKDSHSEKNAFSEKKSASPEPKNPSPETKNPTPEKAPPLASPKEIDQRFTQTTPLPHKITQDTQTISIEVPSPAKRPNTPVPSKELAELLNKLGTLNQRHEDLKAIVEALRLELAKKQQPVVSTDNNKTSNLPDDLAQKLDELKRIKSDLEELKNNFSNETNKRMQLENMLANINSELEKIRNSIKECLRSTQLNKDDIAALKDALKRLEENKADKNWTQSEFERKADKRDVDGKVNRKLFDDTTQELSQSVNGCIKKTGSLDDEMKRNNEHIFKELEQKLDRLELDSLKEYVEKQMKKLKNLQKRTVQPEQNVQNIMSEDDAAGLRKQLLRFHCISCDRPIDVTSGSQIYPSMPNEKGMRPIQTPRPYTTYELDQIRQFQKSQVLQDQSYDLFASVRQCGGPHTLTVPHKKLLKIPQPLAEDPVIIQQQETQQQIPHPAAAKHNEVQIQGQDGHIYKGRIDARLNVEMKKPIKNSNGNFNRSYSNLANNHEPGKRDSSDDQTKPVYTN
jgi:DNA repair exonuclease SbcCD ATPase subunit